VVQGRLSSIGPYVAERVFPSELIEIYPFPPGTLPYGQRTALYASIVDGAREMVVARRCRVRPSATFSARGTQAMRGYALPT